MTALAGDLFDLADARAAAKRGMDLTLNAQAVDWIELYRIHSERFLNSLSRGDTFIGEDIRKYVQEHGGSPRSPNSWGAAMRGSLERWREEGVIEADGLGTMTSVSSHARLTPRYRYVGPVEHFPITDDTTMGAI